MQGKLVLTGVCALVLGMTINNFALSDVSAYYKVGTVDIQKIVESSKAVSNLKSENKKQIDEYSQLYEKAKADIEKETDIKKRKALETKYTKALNDKKASIDKSYNNKLANIDKDISNIIKKEAEFKGYDIVFAKGVVLYGGDDITQEILKAVK